MEQGVKICTLFAFGESLNTLALDSLHIMSTNNVQRGKVTKKWMPLDDQALLKAVKEERDSRGNNQCEDDEDWESIAEKIPGKSAVQCVKRYISLIGLPSEVQNQNQSDQVKKHSPLHETLHPRLGNSIFCVR